MKCPGQDMKYWNSDAIYDVECPQCKRMVEFYKDDTTRKCNFCGHRFVNPKMDFGCATYCQFAEQCLGTLPEEFAGARNNLLKDKVAVEMKRFWGTNFKNIRRSMTTARYAEIIGKRAGANLAIVLCAAYVKDIEPEQSKAILEKAGATMPMIYEIQLVIEELVHPQDHISIAAQIVHDALALRSVQEQVRESQISSEQAEDALKSDLITSWGKELLAEAGLQYM